MEGWGVILEVSGALGTPRPQRRPQEIQMVGVVIWLLVNHLSGSCDNCPFLYFCFSREQPPSLGTKLGVAGSISCVPAC